VKTAPRARGVRLDFSTNEEEKYSPYYLAVSRRYRVARYVSILLLAVFLLVMLVFYRENITYANLMYLARDLNSDTKVNLGVYSDLSYTERIAYDFGFYRQRLAVATNTGFTLYSRSGSADLETSEVMKAPRLETGEKYALVYDAGSTSYSVFTTVARVLYANAEFEIEDAAICDEGTYALLTKSDDSRSLITVYNKDFSSVMKYHKDNFVMDIALDKEGEHIAVVSCNFPDSEISCEIMLGKVATEESVYMEYDGLLPVACRYTEDGKLVVVCDAAILIFDGEREIKRIDFGGVQPGSFDIEKNIIAVSFPDNVLGNENNVKIFDSEGKELYNVKISEKITTLVTDGEESVYTVGETSACRISLENGKSTSTPVTDRPIGAVAVPGSLVVFSPEKSKTYFAD